MTDSLYTFPQIVYLGTGAKIRVLPGRCHVCGGPLLVTEGRRPMVVGDLWKTWTDEALVKDRMSPNICAGCEYVIGRKEKVVLSDGTTKVVDVGGRGFAEGAKVFMGSLEGNRPLTLDGFWDLLRTRAFPVPSVFIVNHNYKKHAFLRALDAVTLSRDYMKVALFEVITGCFDTEYTGVASFDPGEMARTVEAFAANAVEVTNSAIKAQKTAVPAPKTEDTYESSYRWVLHLVTRRMQRLYPGYPDAEALLAVMLACRLVVREIYGPVPAKEVAD